MATGYAAEVCDPPAQRWVMFALSTFYFIVILGMLLKQMQALRKLDSASVEARAFKFLGAWTVVIWSAYPVLFVLVHSHAIDRYIESIALVVLDFFVRARGTLLLLLLLLLLPLLLLLAAAALLGRPRRLRRCGARC